MEPIFRIETQDPAGSMKAIQRMPGLVEVAMFGRALHVTVQDPIASGIAVTRILLEAGLPPSRVSRIRPSLEDVFVSLVRAEGGSVVG